MPYSPGSFFPASKYIPYPQFLASAATYAKWHTKAEVLFRDSIARHETYAQFFDYLKKESPDIIFIECATPSWEHDKRLIQQIVGFMPSVRIAIAGTLSSVRSSEVLNVGSVVAAIKGEYEKNAVKVIEGATGLIEHDLLTTEEMNAAPFPYYENATARNYWDSNPKGIIYPHAQVWTSRGCMFKCNFCVFPAVMTGNDPDGTHTRKVRFHSEEYMEAFFGDLIKRYGFRSLYLDDDTANLSDKHTLAICRVMRKLNIPWSAMCRADTSSREVWQEMKDSGCYGVKIGFESGSQRIIDRVVNKRLNLEEAEATGRYLTEIGINWHGTFMLGHPSETPEESKMTHALIERCKKAGMSSYQLSGTAVHDGTPLDRMMRTGEVMSAYPDAKRDESFVVSSDGNKKAQQIT